MQDETLGRDLNDLTRVGARQRCLEHRLVQLRIETVADLRVNHGNPVLGEHVEQFAQGQFDALEQRRCACV